MLEFHPLQQTEAPPERAAELLREFRELLLADGMASMDEYGDMLKWGLPKRDGMCRYFHAYHPDFCTFGDQFRGTIHFHGGEIRGHVLLGHMEHYTYEPNQDDAGDRFFDGTAYSLVKHTRQQPAGTSYSLPALVPHWLKPMAMSLTYFEEEDNELMGDLLNPADAETDHFAWEQEDADAMLPALLAAVETRLIELTAAQPA